MVTVYLIHKNGSVVWNKQETLGEKQLYTLTCDTLAVETPWCRNLLGVACINGQLYLYTPWLSNQTLCLLVNRVRRGMESRSFLDEGRLEKLESGVKQMELISNEAEVKYEEVGDVICLHSVWRFVDNMAH